MDSSEKENHMLIPMPKDIMTRNVVTAKTDTPIYEALELMANNNISGLPVVEDDMTLIGVLSEKDVMTLLCDQEEDEEKTVSDFMTRPALFFDQEEDLLDVCDFLKKNVFRRVPITSKGKLVGIISIRDVLEFILRLRGRVPMSAYASEKE
jgi:CBS domain-containing protein